MMTLQISRNRWIYIVYLFFITLIVFSSILPTGCKDPKPPGEVGSEFVLTIDCTKYGDSLQLDCPALPNTNLEKQPDFDIFAWNTFAALNWPALVDSDTTKFQRGIPSLSKSFKNAKHDDVLVWETFKEKREVFNGYQSAASLPSWNSTPSYGVLRPGTDGASFVPEMLPGSSTRPKGYIFNALDETIQVKSEALEKGPRVDAVHGQVVSPRVWRGLPSDGNPVLYEVKVNFDFYNYLNTANKRWFNQDTAKLYSRDTLNGPFTLPYRTSAGKQTALLSEERKQRKAKKIEEGFAGVPAGPIKNYSSQDALTSYKNANKNPSRNNFPYQIGSVHIKAAWIQLTAKDDTTKYHTTTAQYYVTENKKVKIQYATFGLIGLHIIQRIHTGDPDSTTQYSTGGTFIFATWEHMGNDSGFTYSNYAAKSRPPYNPSTNYGWYPHKNDHIDTMKGFSDFYFFSDPDTLKVRRKYKILPGTKKVNKMVRNALPANSVWRNYQLIGVQFQAIDINKLDLDPAKVVDDNDPTGIGQPLYLANLVIETNEGLQHFQGQPPGTYPIQRYTDTIHGKYTHNPPSPPLLANPLPVFKRSNRNLSVGIKVGGKNAGMNMGGCMGCHGVAQSEGYSFSFVLLGGYAGASTDTQHEFDLPPPTVYNAPN